MTTELAETMAAVFEDLVGTPPPKDKGEFTVIEFLKKLQYLDKQDANVNRSCLAMRAWHEMAKQKIGGARDWLYETYRPTVEAVTEEKIAHSGKKSFNWPYGVCGFKKQQDQYEWPDDETELISWCNANNVNFNTKLTIDKKAIKDHITATGEIPPGVTITPGVEKFYVKPAPLALPSEQPKLLCTELKR